MKKADGVWIWLALTQGFSAGRARRLIETIGSEEAAWEADFSELARITGSHEAEKLIRFRNAVKVNEHVLFCQKKGIGILTPASPLYPQELLTALYDPPCVLYTIGDQKLLNSRCITIVGTRRHTSYGEKVTRRFASELARAGLTIVSGLDEGLSAAAHEAALCENGKTIAIMPCGLDETHLGSLYALRKKIEQKGLLISEFSPGTPVRKYHFAARSRLLGALSLGTLITEAPANSGTLQIVEQAFECGREVFTVPGNIDFPSCAATNRLLRTSAEIALEPKDILKMYDLGEKKTESEKTETVNLWKLQPEEKQVADLIRHEPRSFDELTEITNFQAAKLNSLLTILRLKGIINQTAGRVYTIQNDSFI